MNIILIIEISSKSIAVLDFILRVHFCVHGHGHGHGHVASVDDPDLDAKSGAGSDLVYADRSDPDPISKPNRVNNTSGDVMHDVNSAILYLADFVVLKISSYVKTFSKFI
jgi:hypothetical protein